MNRIFIVFLFITTSVMLLNAQAPYPVRGLCSAAPDAGNVDEFVKFTDNVIHALCHSKAEQLFAQKRAFAAFVTAAHCRVKPLARYCESRTLITEKMPPAALVYNRAVRKPARRH